MYSSKGKQDFDDMLKKTSNINLPEITKMLKDHDIYPALINKDEIATLIRLINMRWKQPGIVNNDLATLDYEQFKYFVPQLAFVCFLRPPIDKSNLPPVACL